VAFGPARRDEPPAEEVISIDELLPREQFIAQSIRARAIERGCTEGEAIVSGFGDIPEAFIRRFVFVAARQPSSVKYPKSTFKFPKLVDGVSRGALQGW
jgi:hypothetical protein